MKNVFRILVKSFFLLLLVTQFELRAQETTSLNTVVQADLVFDDQVAKSAMQENYIVKGIVIDEEELPLGGVNIVLKGTAQGIVTELDGTFEFPRPLQVDDVLIFSYIGYNPQEYKVVESESETIEISITFDLSNISLMGAVEVDGVYSSKRNIFQKFVGLFK